MYVGMCVCVCVFVEKGKERNMILLGFKPFQQGPKKKYMYVHMGSVLYSVQYIQYDITTIHMRTY